MNAILAQCRFKSCQVLLDDLFTPTSPAHPIPPHLPPCPNLCIRFEIASVYHASHKILSKCVCPRMLSKSSNKTFMKPNIHAPDNHHIKRQCVHDLLIAVFSRNASQMTNSNNCTNFRHLANMILKGHLQTPRILLQPVLCQLENGVFWCLFYHTGLVTSLPVPMYAPVAVVSLVFSIISSVSLMIAPSISSVWKRAFAG